jgi:PAS domain S-box-containing protein
MATHQEQQAPASINGLLATGEPAHPDIETAARAALRRQTRFTEVALSSVPDAIYAFDRMHRFVYANQAMQALTGRSSEQIVGRGFADLGFPSELAARLERHIDAVFATGVTVEDELSFPSLGGAPAFYEFRWGPMPSDDGGVELVVGVSRDTTERRRLEERLRESEERTAFLLRLSDALRPLVDAAAIEETSARLLGQHLGLNRVLVGEFVGDEVVIERDWVDGVPSMAGRYPQSDLIRIMIECYRQGQTFVVEDLAHDARVNAHERATWAPDGIGALVSVGLLGNSHVTANFCVQSLPPRRWTEPQVCLVREVAERAWAAMERVRAEEALKQADRHKDEFLATLAHELRNPLAPISNAVHLLRRPDGRRVTDRMIEIVERQVRQIVKLVDDLMEISRITSGKIELDRQTVDLAEAVRDAIENSRPLLERARHHLALELPPRPLRLEADGVRLTQILTNLLNNAAKYTDPGGHIVLTAAREGGMAAIRVRDDGRGIAADQLAKVFEMFAQVRDPALRSGEGLGIGLALVRKLVEMHGGTVEAHSAGLGQGSEFVVRLPLVPDDKDALQSDAADGRGALHALRILVVDDNRDAADTLALLLESHGAKVEAVYDGETALAALVHFQADAVLLDLGMPGMDGLEVARRIRLDARLAGLRLLALTGWGQEADRTRTREAGFDQHLTKPVDFAALEAWLTGR